MTVWVAVKQRNFRRSFLRDYMIENKFPSTLQQRVLDQEEFAFQHRLGMDVDGLWGDFPKALKAEVAKHLYFDLISKVPLFKEAEEVIKVALSQRISTISIQAGFYVRFPVICFFFFFFFSFLMSEPTLVSSV
jgi:hypothetical protein